MRTIFIGVLIAAAVTGPARAEPALNEGFDVTNRNPFLGIYGVSSHQPSRMPAAGEINTDFQLEIHNSFTGSDGNGDSIFIDGESTYATLNLKRGFGDGWAAGLEIPVVSHRGGFLDSAIDDWHDLFGLDQFSREGFEQDQLAYRYIRGGITRAEIDESVTGIGDVRLHLGRSLIDEQERTASAWLQLKLPTGDADDLTGSGGFDLAARVQGSQRLGDYTTVYGGLGLAWLGEGDLLPEMQEDWAGSVTAGVSWQRWSRAALKLQVDSQSALYGGTDLRQIGGSAAQLTFGGSFFVGKRTILDIAAVEDEWKGEASPDFGIHLRLRRLTAP